MEGGEQLEQPDQAAPAAAAAPVAMRQRKNRGNLRKRPAAGDEPDAAAAGSGGAAGDADADDPTSVVRKAKAARGDPLAFSTKAVAAAGRAADVAVTYAGTAEALAAKDGSATRALETETEFDRDAR